MGDYLGDCYGGLLMGILGDMQNNKCRQAMPSVRLSRKSIHSNKLLWSPA